MLILLIRSIFYIVDATKYRKNCFGGICEWGYLGMMYTAGCLFCAPCKEEECKDIKNLRLVMEKVVVFAVVVL